MDKKPLMLTIHHTHKVWSHYMRKMSLELGIPDSYRMIIIFLTRNPGATQKELAKHCRVTHVAISQTIKEMQQDGYITKEISEEDRRVTKLYLTEKGNALDQRMWDRIHEAERLVTSAISPEKEAELVELLDLLTETIQKEL